jgi:CubicO group peptidase (beta-lactamase class C family)
MWVRRLRHVASATLFLASLQHPLRAQTGNGAGLEPSLDSLVQATLREQHIPGLALGVIQNGQLIYAKGFGVPVLGEGRAVTPQSLFHIASLTKPFVATAVLQLVEAGKVDLDARVAAYLPYFRLADERADGITVRQLLTHTSGMPDVTDYGWDHPDYDGGALERYVRGLRAVTLLHAPGQAYRYSNMAYEVLGDLIAKVSGESFEAYIRDHILRPLDMTRSTLLPQNTDPALLTHPYTRDSTGAIVAVQAFPYNRAHAPSSTLRSSVEDLSHWALANLGHGQWAGRRVLQSATYDLLWHAYAVRPGGLVPGDSTDAGVGLSWFLQPYHGQILVLHGGADDGFRSLLILAPATGGAVILLTNYDGAWPATRRVAWFALDQILPPAP